MDASKIRAYRRDTGLTQAQLARRLGVAQPTVCNWEKGRSAPSHRTALKLAAMIGRARIEAERRLEELRVARLITARAARQKLDQQRGTLLRMLRQEHDITLDELAGIIGFAPLIVTRWETGEYTMTLPTVKELERFFRVPMTETSASNRR